MAYAPLPLVTIGIPTYNRANGYLKGCIECAINQTYPNIEIIVSDNCSTDHTETLVNAFDDHRLRYFKHKCNIGANNNFNFCVNEARGVYFLLLHDDDLIDRDFIATCINALNGNYGIGVVFTGNRVIDEHSNVLKEKFNRCGNISTEKFWINWFEGKVSFYLCSTLFNTAKLKKIGGFQSKRNLFQDVVAEVILAREYGRLDVFDIKASFRRHPENRAGKPEMVAAWCEDCAYLLDIICEQSNDKANTWKKGTRFFASKNYKLAEKISPFTVRWKTYYMISSRYQHSFTFFHYLYRSKIKKIKIVLKKLIKRMIS